MTYVDYFSRNRLSSEIVLALMLSNKPLTISEIATQLNRFTTSIHRSIKTLQDSGFITTEKKHNYRLNDNRLEEIKSSIFSYLNKEKINEGLTQLITQRAKDEIMDTIQQELVSGINSELFFTTNEEIYSENGGHYNLDIVIQGKRKHGIVVINNNDNELLHNTLYQISRSALKQSVYSVYIIVFNSSLYDRMIVKSNYDRGSSYLKLTQFKKNYFFSKLELIEKIKEIAYLIRFFESDSYVDVEDLCTPLNGFIGTPTLEQRYLIEDAPIGQYIKNKYGLRDTISIKDIIKILSDFLMGEIKTHPMLLRKVFLNYVLVKRNTLPVPYPSEYLLFDFCLAFLSSDYTDARLYLDHSYHMLGIPYPFYLILYLLTSIASFRINKSVNEFIAILGSVIKPLSANSQLDQYDSNFKQRYSKYEEIMTKINESFSKK